MKRLLDRRRSISQPSFNGRPYEFRSQHRSAKIAVILLILVSGPAVPAIQASLFGMSPGTQVPFSVSLIAALILDAVRIAPLFYFSGRREGLFHPITVTALLWPLAIQIPYLAETIIGNSAGLVGTQLRAPTYGALPGADEASVWFATAKYDLLSAMSLCMLYFGFAATMPKNFLVESYTHYTYNSRGLVLLCQAVVLLVVLGLAVFMVSQGGILNHLSALSGGRARALDGLGPVVVAFDVGTLAMMVWIALRPQDARRHSFIVMLIMVVIVQFVSNGSRSSALLAVASVGLVWSIRSGKIPYRLTALLVPAGLILLSVFAVIRSAGLYGDTAIDAFQRIDGDTVAARMGEELAGRRYLSGSVPVVADSEGLGGPLLGRTYLAAVFAFVPRPIWPDKPRGAGSLFAQTAFNVSKEGFAIPIGPVAEAFWNFGTIGVALAFLFHGIILSRVYIFWMLHRDDPFVVVGYVLVLTSFSVGTDSFVPFLQKAVMVTLLYGIAYALGLRKRVEKIAIDRRASMQAAP